MGQRQPGQGDQTNWAPLLGAGLLLLVCIIWIVALNQ